MKASLVIPVYNERENVRLLHAQICQTMEPTGATFEIVFVDDGSTDGTDRELVGIVAQDSRVRVIRLRKNSGQTVALAAGIENSRGEIVVTLDGDLQNDPRDAPLFISRIEQGADLVTGWRSRRQDPFFSRRLPSLIANRFISRFLGVRIHDFGCGIKAYRGELIRRIPLYSELHRFLPAMCTMATSRIVELEVRHHPRRYGKSKYGLSRIWRVLADILTIKMLLSCARRPLHWFGYWSFAVFSVTAVSMIYSLLVFLRDDWTIGFVLPGATALLGYLGFCLLFSGVFADIVVRSELQDRPTVLTDVVDVNAERSHLTSSNRLYAKFGPQTKS